MLAVALLHIVLAPVALASSVDTGSSSLRGLGYAFATILVFIGVIAYALGQSDIAKSSWAWAIVVAVVVAWVSSYTGGLPGAAGEYKVFWPPSRFYRYVPVTVVVAQPGAEVSVSIDWGRQY